MKKLIPGFFFVLIFVFGPLNKAQAQAKARPKENPLIPQMNCQIGSYLSTILKTNWERKKENIYQTIENHANNPIYSSQPVLPYCKPACNNVSINSLYESFLSKEVMLNRPLRKKIGAIFKKIIMEMEDYPKTLKAWESDQDFTHVLPVTQKGRIKNKIEALEMGDDPALQLDFLLYRSKGLDGIGIGKNKKKRDTFYNSILKPNRGQREDLNHNIKRIHYGIVKFDVPELEVPNGYPWEHWGRDTCKVVPDSSPYNKLVTKYQIPLVCGISGSTTMALWTMLLTKTDIDENEMRLILLSVWSTLCGDGGHSLQEVLSSARLNADYLPKILDSDEELRNSVSLKTISSLQIVTQGINPGTVSEESPGRFGSYYDSFFRKISDSNFLKARKAAQMNLQKYFKTHCL